MICDPCKAGDHCGPPGQVNRACPCQHRPPGTGQEQGHAVTQAPSGPSPVSQDPPAAPREPQGHGGLRAVLAGVSTVDLVADWMASKRRGAKAREAIVGSILAERFGRNR